MVFLKSLFNTNLTGNSLYYFLHNVKYRKQNLYCYVFTAFNFTTPLFVVGWGVAYLNDPDRMNEI